MKKIVLIVGARPNFMKAYPVYQALKDDFELTLIHTGQHFDAKMSDIFFNQLKFPKPDIHFDLESKTRAGEMDNKLYVENTEYLKDKSKVIDELAKYDGKKLGQLGEIRDKLCEEFKKIKPDLVIVFGDVTSTLSATLSAKILGIEVAHVESGLRSGDLSMPEEVNRILTDIMANYYFITEQSGVDNLKKEGLDKGNLYLVGNTMIDCLFMFKDQALQTKQHEKMGVKDKEYILITLHRPGNVDDIGKLNEITMDIIKLSENEKIIFPIHPRTRKNLEQLGLIDKMKNIIICEPLGYLEFTCLEANAKYVITDSGGIQEETTALNVPCFTLRPNTERPSTLIENGGTNILIGKITNVKYTNNGNNNYCHKFANSNIKLCLLNISNKKIALYISEIMQEYERSKIIYGNIESEIKFNLIVNKLLGLVLKYEKYSDEIYYKISDLYKSYCKKYNTLSLLYSGRGYKSVNSTKNNLIQYIENICYIYDYEIAMEMLSNLNNKLEYTICIVELYKGLLKYINRKDGYLDHFVKYKNLRTIKNPMIYQDIPFSTYCIDKTKLEIKNKYNECFKLEDIDINNSNDYEYVVVTSVEINYFIVYHKYLINSFKCKNTKTLLIIDLIINKNDDIPNKYIELLKENYKDIRINIKYINEKYIRAYSSVLRLFRAGYIIEKFGKPVLVIDFDSVFINDISELFLKMKDYDICTRELDKVYPWQKYTCGFLFCNSNDTSLRTMKYIMCHIDNLMNFNNEQWWIDQNGVEAGIAKIIEEVDIKKKDLFAIKANYILSPTGSKNIKMEILNSKCNMKNYENVIVFAHPDDETIFFYDFINEKSLLILVTKSSSERINILKEIATKKRAELILLNEKDSYETKDLTVDTKYKLLEILLNIQYEKLITHNKDGEYGHIQHKLINIFLSSFINLYTTNYNVAKAGAFYKYNLYNHKVKNGLHIDQDLEEKYRTYYKFVNYSDKCLIADERANFLEKYSKCHNNSIENLIFFTSLCSYSQGIMPQNCS